MSRRARRFLTAAAVLTSVLLAAPALRPLWTPSSDATHAASGAVTLTGGTADHVVDLTISAPVTGMTAVDVRLAPRGRGATDSSPSVTVSAVLPTAGHAVPGFTAVRTTDNRYHVSGLPLMMTGRWQFLVDIDGHGRHDQLIFPFTISR